MYGMAALAIGARRFARGRMQVSIMPDEHAGQSESALIVVDQVGPVADRPVIADGDHHRHVHPPRRADRAGRRQQVLAVDDVDAFVADERLEVGGERALEAFVLEVVAHERQAGRVAADLAHGEILELREGFAGRLAGARSDDGDLVSGAAQAARQLVGAPAASAADGREGVGDQEDVHQDGLVTSITAVTSKVEA